MNEKPISCRWPQPAFQTPLGQAVSHPSQTANSKRRRASQTGPSPGLHAKKDPPGKRKRKLNVSLRKCNFLCLSYKNIEFTFAFTGGVPCHFSMICRADCCAYSGRSAVCPAVGKFGWRPAFLVDQCLACRVGGSAGCAPTAWLAKRLLAAWPALGCHSEQYSTE